MNNSKSIRKSLKFVAIAFISTLILVIIASAVISLTYEKAIVRYMKGYLDEHLLTRLSMDDIRFRFFKGFPNTTIEISNVVLSSGKDFSKDDFPAVYSDTLLYAKKVYLQFDLLKMYRKEYELKRIEISEGKLNILFDKKNRHNLDIWKSSGVKNYSVNLRNIELNGMQIRVISHQGKFDMLAFSEKTQFRGKFSENILSGETRGNLRINDFKIKEKSLISKASLQLDLNMIYQSKHFRISKGKVQLNKAIALLEGEFTSGKENTIDLRLDIPKFGLNEIISIIPSGTKLSAGKYAFSGNGNLHLEVKGSLTNMDHLLVRSQFALDNGKAQNTETRSSLNNLHLKGTISGTRADNFTVRIDTLHAKLGSGSIQGKIDINNMKTLMFRSDVQAELDLDALKKFAGIDSAEKMTGRIRTDFTAAGSFKSILSDSALMAIKTLQKGHFYFENAGIKLKNIPLNIENINGSASMDQQIQLDSLSLRINETDLLVSGRIQNLNGYLLYQELLKSDLYITTDILDISKYLKQPTSKQSPGYNRLSIFPENHYLKARIRAKQFIAGKFESSDVTVSFAALKDSIYLDQFTLKFPDGSITGVALIIADQQNKISVTCNAKPEKINIQQLFYAFNNFTQHFIIDKNLKGLLGGTLNFSAQWDSTLHLIPSSIKAKGDFQITNGELINFEPMLKLSKYIDVDELRLIRFKTLKNTIDISNLKVFIPEMAIHSSAFNIRVSGQHSFDNQFDYRLRVLLSEVLFNKARKKKKEIDEFLIEETRADQTNIPLIIAGTPTDFDVRFDRKKAFNLTGSKNKERSSEIIKPADNIKIEWEEPVEQPKKEQKSSRSDPSDVVIEWDD